MPGVVAAYARAAEPHDRLSVQPLGRVTLADQCARPGIQPAAPIRATGARHLGELLDRVAGELRTTAAHRRLDELGKHPVVGRVQPLGGFEHLLGRGQGGLVLAECVVEQRVRPLGRAQAQPTALAVWLDLLHGRCDQPRQVGRPAPPGREHEGAEGRELASRRPRGDLHLVDHPKRPRPARPRRSARRRSR